MSVLCYAPFFMPLFWLGIIYARSVVLERPSQLRRLRSWALALGLGVGLPLNLLALVLNGDQNLFVQLGWELLPGPLLAVGYVMLGAMWAEGGRASAMQ